MYRQEVTTLEEILKQLLAGQSQLLNRLAAMDDSINMLEHHISKLDTRMDKLEHHMDHLTGDMDKLDHRLATLEGQLQENTQFIHALLHRTEELDAKFDSLLLTTLTKDSLSRVELKMATKEDIDRIAFDIHFLVRKTAEHDTEIRQIRKAAQ
jgi:chromosome segregation ATPase